MNVSTSISPMLGAFTWANVPLWPVAAGVVLAAMALSVWLYPAQLRRAGGHWAWVLPALRLAAIGALAVSLLRPVIIRATRAEERGAVIVLMDRSLSMGSLDHAIPLSPGPDRARTIGRLVALADAKGRLPQGARERAAGVGIDVGTLETLAEDVARAKRELEYAGVSGRDVADPQRRLNDAVNAFAGAARTAETPMRAAGRVALADALAGLAKVPSPLDDNWVRKLASRVAGVGSVLREAQDAADESLYDSDADVREVCDSLSRQSRLWLGWDAIAGSGGFLSKLEKQIPVVTYAIGDGLSPIPTSKGQGTAPEAQAPQSDLVGGLRQALRQTGASPVQAVILVSDGRQVGAESSLPAGLLPTGVPVFTVLASAARVRDMAITSVEAPRAVFAGESATVRIAIRTQGMDPTRVVGPVTLKIDGATASTQPVLLRDRKLSASLEVKLDKPGARVLRVEMPTLEGELSAANNAIERRVKVLAQRVRVVMVAGAPTWDYRYARAAMAAAPWVDLKAAVAGDAPPSIDIKDFEAADLVVLFDVGANGLSAAQWQAVIDAVEQRGASAIVVAGARVPDEYGNGPQAKLVPFAGRTKAAWRTWPGENPHYRFVPSPGTEQTEALRLGDDPEQSRRHWEEMGATYRYLAMPPLAAGARVLLMERESKSPVLVESKLGRGNVLFLGTTEIWRWRERGAAGEADHDRFWMQLARHVIDEPYAMADASLAFDVDRLTLEPGESLRLRARVTGRKDREMPASVSVAVRAAGRDDRRIDLLPVVERAGGRYAGILHDLGPGDCVVEPLGEDGSASGLRLSVRVERSAEAELSDLSPNRDFLQRLAESSGGRLLTLEQVPTLPGLLAESRLRQPRTREIRLWDSGYLFIFVLACLSAEWAIRKRVGLA